MNTTNSDRVLHLHVGEWIEVRSAAEILATLDERGRLENLPFMPEMLAFCGQRFRVYKRADKACDNIKDWSMRRMRNAVHLETRCNGSDHDGCQAGCLLFWKEAWLKRVDPQLTALAPASPAARKSLFTVEDLMAATRTRAAGELTYSCQATELRNFTSDLPWWRLGQYIRDVTSGNLAPGIGGPTRSERLMEVVVSILRLFQGLIIMAFNGAQKKRHGVEYPNVHNEHRDKKTPIEVLNLQPGEVVQVRSKEEILATLDDRNRNRGLLYDAKMLRWSGSIYRVLRRVNQIIDEKTGKMIFMKNACIVLEGVACQADYHRFCPKMIYHYWREGWLRRVSDVPMPAEGGEQNRREECAGCPT